MNIVPKQGGNSLSGLFAVSGFSKAMQSDNYTDELRARGASDADADLPRLRRQRGGRRPDHQGQALVLHERPRSRARGSNILNVFYNQNAGNATQLDYDPDFSRPAYYDRTWENYTPAHHLAGVANRNKFSFSWDEQPVCRTCTGTASFSGSPAATTAPEADGHGEFSPQRVQTARWTIPLTNRLLLEAGFGTTYYQWAGQELDPNPTRDLVRVIDTTRRSSTRTGAVGTMTYRSQNW